MKEPVYDTGIEVDVLEAVPDLPRLPDVYKARDKADALMVPDGYMGVVSEHVRSALLNVRFKHVVETDPKGRLHTKSHTGGRAFTVGNPRESLRFDLNDPYRPGMDKFDWFPDPGDPGVEYGFLKYKQP